MPLRDRGNAKWEYHHTHRISHQLEFCQPERGGIYWGKTYHVDRVSDTEVTVELEFNGNINADSTLTFTVGADAIANYNGPAFTAQVPVSANTESLVATTAAPLTEATLDGNVVTLRVTGGIYKDVVIGTSSTAT